VGHLPTAALQTLDTLNTGLISRSGQYLKEHTVPVLNAKGRNEKPGSAKFNLTLINRMAPKKYVSLIRPLL
jgi:hypothetical protein